MKVIRGKTPKPGRRILLYGVHGVGKSTWAAQADGVLFLNVEDGLDDIDCAKTEHIRTAGDLQAALKYLKLGEIKPRWIAIDTLDHMEKLIWSHVADQAGKDSIGDIGYGAGYKRALAIWSDIQSDLDYLRTKQGIGTIALAHAEIKRFDNPETESYDRYRPALHDAASALWQEWCDEVLFASYRMVLKKEDQGFGKERAIATGQGERYLRTTETPFAVAKNRLGLPAEMNFNWNAYAEYLPEVGNVQGMVKDGSSKSE